MILRGVEKVSPLQESSGVVGGRSFNWLKNLVIACNPLADLIGGWWGLLGLEEGRLVGEKVTVGEWDAEDLER